jgi:hypothetical protein
MRLFWPTSENSTRRVAFAADRFHADAEIVSRAIDGPIHRYDYRQDCEVVDSR